MIFQKRYGSHQMQTSNVKRWPEELLTQFKYFINYNLLTNLKVN